MLGRLGMTVDETIGRYLEFTENIFQHSHWFSMQGLLRPKYSQKKLRRAARLVVGESDIVEKTEGWRRNLFSAPSAPCRTYVETGHGCFGKY